MFAVAAFALTGMMVTPAFATDVDVEINENATNNNTSHYTSNDFVCGNHVAISEVWISESNPGSEDSVKIKWDASRCGSNFTDASVMIYVDGDYYGHFWDGTNAVQTLIFGGSISPGDLVEVTFTYDIPNP